MLTAENLTFSWQENKKNAFEEVNFSLKLGEILCICGANGSGKSTLLQTLAGILVPTAGAIDIAKQLRSLSALLLQDPDMQILGQTPLNDMLLPYSKPTESDRALAYDIAKQLNLFDFLNTPVQNLSYGQKRKLCFASALMMQPKLLLLDEPTAGLDYPALFALREIISKNKKNEITQCITTHDLESLIDLADKVLILDAGKQIFYGIPEDALSFMENHESIGIRLPCSWRLNRSIMPW